jgi:hypothetical protein
MNGVPLAVVSRYLGHADIQMTMRYAHLSPDNDERPIAAMMSVYAKRPDATAGSDVPAEGHGVPDRSAGTHSAAQHSTALHQTEIDTRIDTGTKTGESVAVENLAVPGVNR